MHLSAKNNAQRFYDAYVEKLLSPNIVEIGSQDVNGSIRPIFKNAGKYTGIDFAVGNGVDIVLEDHYKFPLEDSSVDVVVSSSCFEHASMFWLTFLEIMRILKPDGLFYLNAPSNGGFHRFPCDYWRFYPDAGNALVTWAKRNNINAVLLESFISYREGGRPWNDFAGVFLKDESQIGKHSSRILDTFKNFYDGHRHGNPEILNHVWTFDE